MIDERKIELSKKLIFEALRKYRDLFDFPPNDHALETYSEMLASEFEFKQVTCALTEHVRKGAKKFPSCGEIFSYLTPNKETKEDRAPIIVKEIIQAIRIHPYDLEGRMFAELSDEAIAVIEANGGTRSIRDSENFETMSAQLERLAKGVLASRESTKKNAKLESIGIVLEMKRPALQKVDYSNYLPTDMA